MTIARRKRSRRLRWLAALGVAVVALAGAGAVFATSNRDSLPERVVISGTDVGGLEPSEARSILEQTAATSLRRPIELVYPDGVLMTSGVAIGLEPDIDSAIERALSSRSLLGRWGARLGIGDVIAVPLTYRAPIGALETFAARIAKAVDRDARSATLSLEGGELRVSDAAVGRALDRQVLTDVLRTLPSRVELEFSTVAPEIGTSAATAAGVRADALLHGQTLLAYRTRRVALARSDLLAAVQFVPRPAKGSIELRLRARELRDPLRAVFGRYERPARDAAFRIRGGRVTIVKSTRGREIDVRRTAFELARSAGNELVRVRFRRTEPQLTTETARSYRIRTVVGEFTTPFPCCQPRVENIALGAELIDGAVIAPGEAFSLNRALGRRTRARGFVKAPMIFAGRLVDAVGGGVSQIATTFFNAAFFAGLELVAHTPHQFFISRYPVGREATVSWGGPELVVRNDWPAGVLVEAAVDETSITVRLWSAKLGRRVETETGEPYDLRSAQILRVPNAELPPGTEQVVQTGGSEGFSVDYTRRVYRGSRLIRDERFTTRYDPENTIIEYGP